MTASETLDDLEGPSWSDPPYPSTLVERIRALGTVPLRDFTPENFRLIIGQHRALETLLPLALDLLESDPFAEGDFYPGDLLVAVARVPAQAWDGRGDLRQRLKRVAAAAIARLEELDEGDREDLEPELRGAYEAL